MGARMESKMREDLFDQYERFSFAYFDRNSTKPTAIIPSACIIAA